MKKRRLLPALVLFLAGLLVLTYPLFTRLHLTDQLEKETLTFLPPVETFEEAAPLYPELLCAMQTYNEALYRSSQALLTDLNACEESSFCLGDYGLDTEVFAVLDIPALSLHMPVYLGASEANLARGAAILSQTSMPVGGSNTNSVIAGHRGYKGADYFRYVPELHEGDTVTLTTLWGQQHYRVTEIRIIEPYDTGAILIQPQRELLTLLTCHPYASGGKYRCAVYCERSDL